MTKVSIIFNSEGKAVIISTSPAVAKDTHLLLCRYYPTQQWNLCTWGADQMITEVPAELLERYNREFEEEGEEESDNESEYGSEEDEDSD